MTTTNQAFIKAYRTDEPQTAPASPTIAGPARPQTESVTAPAAHASVTASAGGAADSIERSAIYGPRSGARAPATPHTSGATRPSRPGNPGSSEKRPLSSYIASTGIARLSSEPADADFFRPGTTVASFHWPEVCRSLSRQCGPQLGRVADLLMTHAAAGRSLIAILSARSGRGASTLAICLAARLAERRRRVVVVDGNFRRPGLAAMLEVEPTAGWQDVLKHGSPLTDAAIRATDDRLDLLALGAKTPNDPLKLVSGLQAVVTAGVLRHAYDHVLIDAGPFADAASQPIALELIRNMGVDAAMAVTGSSQLDTKDIAAMADQLALTGCDFLGTIVNRAA